MPVRVRRAVEYVTRGIWLKDPAEMPFLRSHFVRFARVVVLTVRGFYRHRESDPVADEYSRDRVDQVNDLSG